MYYWVKQISVAVNLTVQSISKLKGIHFPLSLITGQAHCVVQVHGVSPWEKISVCLTWDACIYYPFLTNHWSSSLCDVQIHGVCKHGRNVCLTWDDVFGSQPDSANVSTRFIMVVYGSSIKQHNNSTALTRRSLNVILCKYKDVFDFWIWNIVIKLK